MYAKFSKKLPPSSRLMKDKDWPISTSSTPSPKLHETKLYKSRQQPLALSKSGKASQSQFKSLKDLPIQLENLSDLWSKFAIKKNVKEAIPKNTPSKLKLNSNT
jgi:hypothetical protein